MIGHRDSLLFKHQFPFLLALVAPPVGFVVREGHPVGAAAALLIVTAVVDLAAGGAGLTSEAPGLLLTAGWLLLDALARHGRARERG